jgi:hypothetical protein
MMAVLTIEHSADAICLHSAAGRSIDAISGIALWTNNRSERLYAFGMRFN